jgi:hypothetical protein
MVPEMMEEYTHSVIRRMLVKLVLNTPDRGAGGIHRCDPADFRRTPQNRQSSEFPDRSCDFHRS